VIGKSLGGFFPVGGNCSAEFLAESGCGGYNLFVLQPGESLDGYRVIRLIGSGGFGAVWLCQSEALGDYRALKFIPALDQGRIQKEFDALCRYRAAAGQLRSPSVLPIEHVNRRSDGLFYITPLADGYGSSDPLEAAWCPLTLAAVLDRRRAEPAWFTGDEVKGYITPILAALQLLSDAGLVHRDVKPENILILNGSPCLGDIGLLGKDSDNLSICGTPGYSAPSWFLESGGHPDMYGAATTLYSLLTGNPPDKMGRAAYRWPPQGEASLPKPEQDEWKRIHALIRRALHDKPEGRFFDFQAFAEKLQDPSGLETSQEQEDDSGREHVPSGKIRGRKSCIAGFIFGILGIYGLVLPVIGIPISIVGLLLSLNGMKSPLKRFSLAGVSLNIVFLVLSIINSAIGFYLGWTGRIEF